MEIRGVPNVRVRYEPEFGGDPEEYVAAPTANPAVNAIPAVVAARPGPVSHRRGSAAGDRNVDQGRPLGASGPSVK